MIGTLLRISSTNLRRDRVAQALTFLLPILFFSIFAMVFGGRDTFSTSRIPVAIADESGTATSRRLVQALAAEKGLKIQTTWRETKKSPEVTIDRARAEAMVKAGDVPVALVLPGGIDSSLARFDDGGVAIELLSDPSDPVAPQVVGGLLQRAVMTSAPGALARHGIEQFERYTGGLTPDQRRAVDGWYSTLESQSDTATTSAGAGSAGLDGMARVEVREVLGDRKDNGMVAFYAAGIAVMFLLFSCSAGAGALLDEVDTGTLDRVLSSRVGMNGLLAGKWLFLTLLGTMQIVVMFVWGMVVFRLDLMSHLPGFALMTVVTAATAAGFGLLLATAARTRAQLSGISTIVILSLSAVGGSMFPRFLMSESMQRFGLVAFNAWALDGFIKVFWRDAKLVELVPQIAVLLAFTAAFLGVARVLARRWETS